MFSVLSFGGDMDNKVLKDCFNLYDYFKSNMAIVNLIAKHILENKGPEYVTGALYLACRGEELFQVMNRLKATHNIFLIWGVIDHIYTNQGKNHKKIDWRDFIGPVFVGNIDYLKELIELRSMLKSQDKRLLYNELVDVDLADESCCDSKFLGILARQSGVTENYNRSLRFINQQISLGNMNQVWAVFRSVYPDYEFATKNFKPHVIVDTNMYQKHVIGYLEKISDRVTLSVPGEITRELAGIGKQSPKKSLASHKRRVWRDVIGPVTNALIKLDRFFPDCRFDLKNHSRELRKILIDIQNKGHLAKFIEDNYSLSEYRSIKSISDLTVLKEEVIARATSWLATYRSIDSKDMKDFLLKSDNNFFSNMVVLYNCLLTKKDDSVGDILESIEKYIDARQKLDFNSLPSKIKQVFDDEYKSFSYRFDVNGKTVKSAAAYIKSIHGMASDHLDRLLSHIDEKCYQLVELGYSDMKFIQDAIICLNSIKHMTLLKTLNCIDNIQRDYDIKTRVQTVSKLMTEGGHNLSLSEVNVDQVRSELNDRSRQITVESLIGFQDSYTAMMKEKLIGKRKMEKEVSLAARQEYIMLEPQLKDIFMQCMDEYISSRTGRQHYTVADLWSVMSNEVAKKKEAVDKYCQYLNEWCPGFEVLKNKHKKVISTAFTIYKAAESDAHLKIKQWNKLSGWLNSVLDAKRKMDNNRLRSYPNFSGLNVTRSISEKLNHFVGMDLNGIRRLVEINSPIVEDLRDCSEESLVSRGISREEIQRSCAFHNGFDQFKLWMKVDIDEMKLIIEGATPRFLRNFDTNDFLVIYRAMKHRAPCISCNTDIQRQCISLPQLAYLFLSDGHPVQIIHPHLVSPEGIITLMRDLTAKGLIYKNKKYSNNKFSLSPERKSRQPRGKKHPYSEERPRKQRFFDRDKENRNKSNVDSMKDKNSGAGDMFDCGDVPFIFPSVQRLRPEPRLRSISLDEPQSMVIKVK
jgi:hypothetical protein